MMDSPKQSADGASVVQDQLDELSPVYSRPLHVKVLSRRRWQILLGLFFAVLIPALIRWPDDTLALRTDSLNNALLGTTVALLLGYFFARRLTVFPGLQIFSFILPSFAASYGLMAAILLLSRVDYSRFQILASFVVAVGFYHYAFLVEYRMKRPRFAVVLGGHVSEIMQYDRADWFICKSHKEIPYRYDGLVADLRADLGPDWEAFLAKCALAGVPVYHSKQVQESLTGQVSIEHLSENTIGSLIPSSIYARVKVAGDMLLAVLLAPLVVLICSIVAALIKFDSPGPVLFVQERVGYRGRVFRMYKLRTMREDHDGHEYTQDNDPRVTRVGFWLRKYRLDELPQIINILMGEMSWIGPRPESLPLSQWYESEIPFYSYRHIVRPGISGWAQIHQGNVARPENVKYKLRYDFYYIKNFSAWMDFVIAAQSIRIILTGFGSK